MERWSNLHVLEEKAQSLRLQLLNEPRNRFNIRRLNRAQAELSSVERDIERDLRSRRLLLRLKNKNQPITIPRFDSNSSNKNKNLNSKTPLFYIFDVVNKSADSGSEADGVRGSAGGDNQHVTRFLQSLTIPKPAAIDKRAIVYVDKCPCGTEMERHPSMSYLICPACSFKRIEIDMCAKDLNILAADPIKTSFRVSRATPKKAARYNSFLGTPRNKKQSLDPNWLTRICTYAYAEGARSADDIDRKLVNCAQRHIGGSVAYNKTNMIVAALRGSVVVPEAVKKQMVAVYVQILRIYTKYRRFGTGEKPNMPKFQFLSRIICRLLGYDVLLPLFDEFNLSNISVQRTSFMRWVIRQLGWEWCDEISDVPACLLDAYEANEGISYGFSDEPTDGSNGDDDDSGAEDTDESDGDEDE